ncbi:MAG: pyruvate, water dikinase regulatory protein [Anaerolineales bacterium]
MSKIFAVSDASGTTANMVARAALAQFDTQVELRRYPHVRTSKRVHEIATLAALEQAIVVHTLVSEDLRREMFNAGRAHNIAAIDLMGPLLARLSETLSTTPRAEPGIFLQPFDAHYIQRIKALEFAVRHDDGGNRKDLAQAEIALVGISRTAKTPLSVYLAYRGWKVANIPLVLGLAPPKKLFDLPKNRVVGLTVSIERLKELRRMGEDHPAISPIFYGDPDYIRKEWTYAGEIFARGGWPLVDMTHKSVEEAGVEIVTLVGNKVEGENT